MREKMKNTKNLKNTTNESVDLKTFRNDLGQWEIFDDQDRLAPFPHSSKAEAMITIKRLEKSRKEWEELLATAEDLDLD